MTQSPNIQTHKHAHSYKCTGFSVLNKKQYIFAPVFSIKTILEVSFIMQRRNLKTDK
jgi:hypothetical protein